MPALFFSCGKEPGILKEDSDNYMQLNTRAGEDGNSDKPCFIFWKHSDFTASGFDLNPTAPYVYSLPGGMIDDYNVNKAKYNTGKIYPPLAELVYAVGISPASIPGTTEPSLWKTFAIPTTMAGITDIQCAPVTSGNEQTPFDAPTPSPLIFEHQLTKLEFKGYCGTSMKESETKFIDVEDINISISSDVDDQWEWFPKELTWHHGGVGIGQYKVSAYGSKPAEIVAKVSSSAPSPITLFGKVDINETKSKPIGNFYLMPGFDKITIKIEATYIDYTGDEGKPAPGNGVKHKRVWEEMVIENIHSNIGEPTLIGYSYTIFLGFERSKIVLGVTLKDWEDDIEN